MFLYKPLASGAKILGNYQAHVPLLHMLKINFFPSVFLIMYIINIDRA